MFQKNPIVILTKGYPSKKNTRYTFVHNLVNQFCLNSQNCIVIAPQSVSSILKMKLKLDSFKTVYDYPNSKLIVLRPFYISFSKSLLVIQNYLFKHALLRVLKKINKQYKDYFIYSHFWEPAILIKDFLIEKTKSVTIASGESEINIKKSLNASDLNKIVKGLVAVSSKNLNESKFVFNYEFENYLISPNSVDLNRFKPYTNLILRNQLRIKSDQFIVGFLGGFNNRKGINRLNDALKSINDVSIKAIFIGDGEINPDYGNIIFKEKVTNKVVPDLLNLCNVFVLPTLAEGCSNAIIEAMACGLPIISSDLSFNYDILSSDNSILINPNDIFSLEKAILNLKNNKKLRFKMANNSLIKAQSLCIEKRSKKILKFINE